MKKNAGTIATSEKRNQSSRVIFENRIPTDHAVAPTPNDLLDEQEIASILKCEIATVRYYTKRTKRLAYHVIGKKRLILRKDLEEFLRHQRIRSVNEIPLSQKERNNEKT